MDFQSVINAVLRNPPEAAYYKQRYRENKRAGEDKKGAEPAVSAGTAAAAQATVTAGQETAGPDAEMSGLRALIDAYVSGNIPEAVLENRVQAICSGCDYTAMASVGEIDRFIQDLRWAHDALKRGGWKNLKGRIGRVPYFRFGVLYQRIVNDNFYSKDGLLQAVKRHRETLRRAAAEAYAERESRLIHGDDGYDAADIDSAYFDDEELSMLGAPLGKISPAAEAIEQSI